MDINDAVEKLQVVFRNYERLADAHEALAVVEKFVKEAQTGAELPHPAIALLENIKDILQANDSMDAGLTAKSTGYLLHKIRKFLDSQQAGC